MTGRWTTLDEIQTKVRRRWADGSLLRSLATGEPFPTIDIPVRGPRPADIGEDLGAVQGWVAALESAAEVRGRSRYSLVRGSVGGRLIGRNQLPHRVQVTTYDQAWTLLGVRNQVAAFEELLRVVASEPRIRAWVVDHPLPALEAGADWSALVAAFRWLENERGSGRYLREISAPGVDTKFVERHRALLSRLLEVPSTTDGFADALGLRSKPAMVRLRFDPVVLNAAHPFTEATLRLEQLAHASLAVRRAVIIENEITYLSVPLPGDGVVLWGKGFDVTNVGRLAWLGDADVYYWGDLDTHGFAILNQLRALLPQTQSFLMDRATLFAHRDRWGLEPSPAAGRLDRLTPDEAALYADLVSDAFASNVRLEQERIDWAWVESRLPYK